MDTTAGPRTPLATLAFVATLQISTVSEKWPVDRLGKYSRGVAGVGLAWAVALAVDWSFRTQDAPAVNTAAILVGTCQVVFFVLLQGWPFLLIHRRMARIVIGNVVTITGGIATYLALHTLGLTPEIIGAAAGTTIAAALLTECSRPRRRHPLTAGEGSESLPLLHSSAPSWPPPSALSQNSPYGRRLETPFDGSVISV